MIKNKKITKKKLDSKFAKKKVIKKPTKKVIKTKVSKIKKTISTLKTKTEKRVGKITHYYNNIKVVVVKLSDVLSIGDEIRIKGGKETDFKQKIVSMEIDGQKVKKAKKGQQVGIKIKNRAREDYLVYKIYPVK